MSEQIIKQPDGRLAVFSSMTDSFVVTDATPEEIIEWRAKTAAEAARSRTSTELKRLDHEAPYLQFTLTWEEASRLAGESGTPDG